MKTIQNLTCSYHFLIYQLIEDEDGLARDRKKGDKFDLRTHCGSNKYRPKKESRGDREGGRGAREIEEGEMGKVARADER